MLVELDGARLLTDPVLRDRVGLLRRIAAPAADRAAEHIDAVLLSHLHSDHADLPSLRRIGAGVQLLAPRGARDWLAERGFENVRELGPGDEWDVGPLRVTATRAVHPGQRWPLGAEAEPVGFVVRGSSSVYFAGDTDLFPGMDELAGTIDVALLPVWGWGPALGPGHLDPGRAADAAALIAPRVAIPIHWGTLEPVRPLPRLGDRGRPARDFAALAARRAPGVDVRVLEPGETAALP